MNRGKIRCLLWKRHILEARLAHAFLCRRTIRLFRANESRLAGRDGLSRVASRIVVGSSGSRCIRGLSALRTIGFVGVPSTRFSRLFFKVLGSCEIVELFLLQSAGFGLFDFLKLAAAIVPSRFAHPVFAAVGDPVRIPLVFEVERELLALMRVL